LKKREPTFETENIFWVAIFFQNPELKIFLGSPIFLGGELFLDSPIIFWAVNYFWTRQLFFGRVRIFVNLFGQ
jgi:hypothetical protein